MNILHLEYAGNIGGIEKLCRDIGKNTEKDKQYFIFVHEGGTFYEQMKEEGLDVQCWKLANKEIIKLYRKINKIVHKNEIDAIVVHHPAPLIWLSMLLFLNFSHDTKVIVYVHNVYEEIVKHSHIKRIVYNELLKKCDGVVAISEFVRKTILENTVIPTEKVHVIYNGVKCPDDIPVVTGTVNKPVRIIYVGRLIEQKGVQILLEAVSILRNEIACEVQIIGDGPYREKLEELSRRLNIEHVVNFCGSQRNIPKWLEQSDIFVHPSIGYEGFGISIAEALSYGKICIASCRGGIPEIITDGQDGFLVKAENAKAIAEKILFVCNEMNDEQRLNIKRNAMKRSKDFNIKNVGNQLDSYIMSCNCGRIK